jgi:hypothetical protein
MAHPGQGAGLNQCSSAVEEVWGRKTDALMYYFLEIVRHVVGISSFSVREDATVSLCKLHYTSKDGPRMSSFLNKYFQDAKTKNVRKYKRCHCKD